MFEKQLEKVGDWLYKRLIKIELILLIFAFASYFLTRMNIAGSEIGITAALVILSNTYFFCGLSRESGNSRWASFCMKLVYFTLCIILVGVLFTLMQWPNFAMIINLSLVSSFLALIIGVIEYLFIRKSDVFKKQEFIRLVIGILMVLSLSVIYDTTPFIKRNIRESKIEHNIPEALP
ncbi:MAG: hypothetical protein JXA77_07580 [Bacteroidales bacterium]|nr:hypothetical protein [Bacteroidales bacterium]MBN2821500.1 hypothetical protein [Bacteroidales bacterium]